MSFIGKDPEKLRSYYSDLFGWEFHTNAPVAEAISQPGNYGFVDRKHLAHPLHEHSLLGFAYYSNRDCNRDERGSCSESSPLNGCRPIFATLEA